MQAYPFRNKIEIYGNAVSIISMELGNEHAIIIRSKDIADRWRGLFEMMWGLLPER
jgi:hypothetical protein